MNPTSLELRLYHLPAPLRATPAAVTIDFLSELAARRAASGADAEDAECARVLLDCWREQAAVAACEERIQPEETVT